MTRKRLQAARREDGADVAEGREEIGGEEDLLEL